MFPNFLVVQVKAPYETDGVVAPSVFLVLVKSVFFDGGKAQKHSFHPNLNIIWKRLFFLNKVVKLNYIPYWGDANETI